MVSAQLQKHQLASTADGLRAGAVRILSDVLEILRDRRGLDFTRYRLGTLERRLANRMVAARVANADSYLLLLRDAEAEVDRLAANLTIKVSRFYRNARTFDLLQQQAIGDLRAQFGSPLRAWSAGCAGGEEAWTIAMLLDVSGDTVMATDIDERALDFAQRGEYATSALAELPEDLLARFVARRSESDPLVVADELRERVTFLRHDLASAEAPPGAPFHLICCRNVLIYFDRALQDQALHLLIDSLTPGGVLCLGEAEWPVAATTSLSVVDRRNKIFRRRREAGEAGP